MIHLVVTIFENGKKNNEKLNSAKQVKAKAVKKHAADKFPLQTVAREFEIPSLCRYAKRCNQVDGFLGKSENEMLAIVADVSSYQVGSDTPCFLYQEVLIHVLYTNVFNRDQEVALIEYLMKSSDIYFSLSRK